MDVPDGQCQMGGPDRTRAVRRLPIPTTFGILQQLDDESVRSLHDCRSHARIIDAGDLMQEIAAHLCLSFERKPEGLGPEPDSVVKR